MQGRKRENGEKREKRRSRRRTRRRRRSSSRSRGIRTRSDSYTQCTNPQLNSSLANRYRYN